MTLTQPSKDMYEDFEPKKDSLFFKIGSQGLISFHGQNYHIRRRLSQEQKKRLIDDASFMKVTANCYVNVDKVRGIHQDCIDFGPNGLSVNQLAVNRRIQEQLKQRIAQ